MVMEWRENDAQWYEERMLHCATCGRMIAKRYLNEEVNGASRNFCTLECRSLYHDYLLPERGPDYRPPTDIGERYAELMVK
jgi:hypothetical protein